MWLIEYVCRGNKITFQYHAHTHTRTIGNLVSVNGHMYACKANKYLNVCLQISWADDSRREARGTVDLWSI